MSPAEAASRRAASPYDGLGRAGASRTGAAGVPIRARFRTIEMTHRFESSYASLGRRARWHCQRAIRFLFEEPSHPSLGVRPILPKRVIWEAEAGPGYRLIFRPAGETVLVLDVVRYGGR